MIKILKKIDVLEIAKIKKKFVSSFFIKILEYLAYSVYEINTIFTLIYFQFDQLCMFQCRKWRHLSGEKFRWSVTLNLIPGKWRLYETIPKGLLEPDEHLLWDQTVNMNW